jgi:hypothetical protein
MFTANLILNIYIMLKNILNLGGVSVLSKKQQGSINGGERQCHIDQGTVGSYTGNYFVCFNDDGTVHYFDNMGKRIYCDSITPA